MAYVNKTPAGRWQAVYRDPANRERQKTFDRKTDAETWLATQTADVVRGTHIDPKAGKQSFESFADQWAAAQDWKPTSREGWRTVRARLVTHLGPTPLSAIDLIVLQSTQQKLSDTYARSTVELTMSYAGSIMRSAYASGRIGRDPTRGLRRPKARADESDGKVTPDQVPTRAEALAILNGAPAAFRAAIALGLSGLRVGEVMGMAEDRIELETRRVTVDQQLQRVGRESILTTPKAEKVRTIVVPNLVAVELRRHLRDHRSDGLLFIGRRGAMLRRDQFYASAWRPALKAAGLAEDRFVFHSLRHFCASSLLAE